MYTVLYTTSEEIDGYKIPMYNKCYTDIDICDIQSSLEKNLKKDVNLISVIEIEGFILK